MFGKAKKTVSVAYKEKLLTDIAHYEKRIEEALNSLKKRKHIVSFANESIEDNVTNPYKFKLTPSENEMKQQEASLSERASMTLELSMLTVLQSEINIMVTAPQVRQPVPEDGIWSEVAAECKIDLVSFTITFYAHKPHRKFAPTRYRNVAVTLVKLAHQKELEQSILPKQELPNLALQVLQSYATAFRSRRTTLRELAEKYEDKLSMEAMPSGGYRVRFLELLQVDWALENLWSPIVPFSHRMKFQVEYMPKDYIQAIRKLYKQFNNPLETSERTLILSKIFDICLQAAGPARDLQDTFESDPETAGLLHERRTTIDQEPDVPNVHQSPKKKDPIGKENKSQNRKTSMAPPKTIPKKAKRRKPNERDVIENRKSVKRAIESESSNDSKKSRTDDSDISKSNPGLKAGRVGINKNNETADAPLKTGDTGKDAANNRETVAGLENNVQKSGKVSAKHTKDTDSADTATKENYVMKKRDGKTTKPKESGDMEGDGDIATSDKDVMKKRDGKTIKSKESGDTEGDGVNNAKKNKNVGSSKSSEAGSKGSKKDAKTNDKVTKSEDLNTENDDVRTVKSADNIANINNDKTTDKNDVKPKDRKVESNIVTSKKVVENKANTQNEKSTVKNTVKSKDTEKQNEIGSKKGAESTVNKKVATAKKDEDSVASSKAGTKRSEHSDIVHSKEKNAVSEIAVPKTKATNKEDGENAAHTKDNSTEHKLTKTKKVKDTVSRTSSKTVASKVDEGKTKAASKKFKDTNNVDTVLKIVPDNAETEVKLGGAVGNIREVKDKTKTDFKKPTQKGTNTLKQKQAVSSVINNKNVKEKNIKQTEKVVEKSKVAKENPIETVKKTANEGNNKEKHLAEKGKVTKPKSTEQTGLDKNKMAVDKTKTNLVRPHKSGQNEVLAKKRKTEANTKNIQNNDNQPTTSTADKKQESKSSKPQNDTIILKKNTNRETDNGKNSQNSETTKNQKDMLNITITKSKMIPISKLQTDKQAKTADKLKTKIPMMKSKITFSSLGDKVKINNLGTISKGEKKTQTKIPQKKLPVFKKVGNFSSRPTRISPRKPLTSNPSSPGFSNHA